MGRLVECKIYVLGFDLILITCPSTSSVVDSINNLDVGNPLHVQNSDNSNYVIIPFKLLGTKNYKIWSGDVNLAYKLEISMVLLMLMKLMQFLMGLDDYYQPVRSSLLTRDPIPEVKDAYNVASREESHRGVPESSSGVESKQNATSFVAKTFNNNRRQFNTNFTRGFASNVNRGPNPNLNCKHYGKIRHIVDKCFEIMQKLLSLINDNLGSSIHANMADLKRDKILGTGSEYVGLYLFDMVKDNSAGKSNVVMCFNVSKAKQIKDPFPLSNHKSNTLDELVHLDLWGPYRVPSREG
nr:putative ribonuclease H-like domain-containing protein [Tanacetum cinerariifolium]